MQFYAFCGTLKSKGALSGRPFFQVDTTTEDIQVQAATDLTHF